MLTYTVDENNILSILKDGNVVDVYTPWDSKEGAEAWAEMICSKYNDNPDLPYPPEEIKPETEQLGITEEEAKLLLS